MATIALHRNRQPTPWVTQIDDDDAWVIVGRRWSIFNPRGSRTAYARSNGIYLHRLIVGAKAGEEVDHINGDGLDNRRSNLRIVTHAENLRAARLIKPFVVPPAEHIHTVKMRLADWSMRTYRYDRRTRQRLPDQEGSRT